jgi:hypothetical protein
VSQMKGGGPWRVYRKGENYPGLPISRSFGDIAAHRLGVTTTPDVHNHTLTSEDRYLLLATKSVWYVKPTIQPTNQTTNQPTNTIVLTN